MSKQLTIKEAMQALVDGKKIRHIDWYQHCYIQLEDRMLVDQMHNEWAGYIGNNWFLHEEEPKQERLATTLEEALRAEKLRIEWPEYVIKDNQYFEPDSDVEKFNIERAEGWTLNEITLIHAAINLPGARVVIEA